jgi:polysaccharide export outer membrane protein
MINRLTSALVLLLALTAVRAPAETPAVPVPTATPPADYVIGPEDVLSVVFWRDKDMSLDVTVRPDGRITLPLLNDVVAAGLTPAQLGDRLAADAKRFVEDPNVTVIVRQINSRRVFVTGEVAKPGPYPLIGPTTVLQMLATAGGLREYADAKHILILRRENGRTTMNHFNYVDVLKPAGLRANIELKPGDTIVVP